MIATEISLSTELLSVQCPERGITSYNFIHTGCPKSPKSDCIKVWAYCLACDHLFSKFLRECSATTTLDSSRQGSLIC